MFLPRLIRLLRKEDDVHFVKAVFDQIESSLKRPDNVKFARQKFAEVGGCLISETKRLFVGGFDLSESCSSCLGKVSDLPATFYLLGCWRWTIHSYAIQIRS